MLPDVDLITTDNSSASRRADFFKPTPARWRRADRPEVQLTEATATALITTGRLTPRDLNVIRAVWMYGVMTADQITRLVFSALAGTSAKVTTRRRLNFLYDEHCLNRTWRGWGKDFVYTLDIQGARLLQMEQKNSRVKWADQTSGEPLWRVEHSLGITEFGVQLTLAARTWPGGGQVRWYGEHLLGLTTPAGDPFNPAGRGLLRLGELGLAFFLEWDREADPIGPLEGKIKSYVDFLRSPEVWRNQLPRFPVVLIATTTPARAEDLVAVVGQHLNSLLAAGERLTVLVTTHAQLREHGALGPVWFPAGASAKVDLPWGKGVALPDLMPPPLK